MFRACCKCACETWSHTQMKYRYTTLNVVEHKSKKGTQPFLDLFLHVFSFLCYFWHHKKCQNISGEDCQGLATSPLTSYFSFFCFLFIFVFIKKKQLIITAKVGVAFMGTLLCKSLRFAFVCFEGSVYEVRAAPRVGRVEAWFSMGKSSLSRHKMCTVEEGSRRLELLRNPLCEVYRARSVFNEDFVLFVALLVQIRSTPKKHTLWFSEFSMFAYFRQSTVMYRWISFHSHVWRLALRCYTKYKHDFAVRRWVLVLSWRITLV